MSKLLDELEDMMSFLNSQLSFRYPYMDVQNQDYLSLLNENFSFLDLFAKQSANKSKLLSTRIGNDLIFKECLVTIQGSFAVFQNKWNNVYRNWMVDHKKLKVKENLNQYTDTDHLNNQTLFPLIRQMAADVDYLNMYIEFIISTSVDVLNVIHQIRNIERRNFIIRFFKRKENYELYSKLYKLLNDLRNKV